MVYIDLTVILTVILCVIIFGTGNLGLYITFRGNNINVITYRSSFVVFLGYYFILNYPRLLYMILSFFVYNSDFSQWYIIYTQCVYIIQAAFILFMSLSRFFALFKSKFTFASLAFTNMLAVLMIFLVGLYALVVYVFKDQSNIPRLVAMAIIVANVASAIFSLPGILAICCIRNFEKRQQIKLSVISFFMAAIYLIQFGVSILITQNYRGYVNYNYPTMTSNSYYNGYGYSNTNLYDLVNSIGLVTVSAEIVTLFGSCILYFLLRPQQSTRPQLSTAVMQGNNGTPPVGPLMT